MILHAPGSLMGATDTFDGAVVEVTVGQLDSVGERFLAYGEAVVLARYLDASRLQVPDRMVCPVVAEGQLVGLAIQGQSEELVSEADPERGDLTEQRTQSLDRRSEGGRIAGSVGEEEAVGPGGQDLFWAEGAWHGEDRGAAAPEFPVDRILDTIVEGDDAAAFLPEGRKHRGLGELRARRG